MNDQALDTEKFLKILNNAYNYEEALKRQNLKQQDVDQLREKARDSKYVPKFIIDKQLLLFANAFPHEPEKCAKMLHVYYKMKNKVPEFFSKRDVLGREIQESMDHQDTCNLPVTPDNYNLIFYRLSSFEPKHYVFDEAVKAFITSCEAYSYRNGPRSGTVFVFDLRGATVAHMFRPGLASMRKGMKFLQEGCPLNIKAIHVLNTVPFFDIIMGLIKPLARSELLEKIHFHSSNMDFEKFYKECVPKSHLPADYGGDLESVEALNKQHREKLEQMRDFFLMEEEQKNFVYDKYVEKYGENVLKEVGFL